MHALPGGTFDPTHAVLYDWHLEGTTEGEEGQRELIKCQCMPYVEYFPHILLISESVEEATVVLTNSVQHFQGAEGRNEETRLVCEARTQTWSTWRAVALCGNSVAVVQGNRPLRERAANWLSIFPSIALHWLTREEWERSYR